MLGMISLGSLVDLYIFAPMQFPACWSYFLGMATFSSSMIAQRTFISLSKHILWAIQTASALYCPITLRVPSMLSRVGPGLGQFSYGIFVLGAYSSAGLRRPDNPKSVNCIADHGDFLNQIDYEVSYAGGGWAW